MQAVPVVVAAHLRFNVINNNKMQSLMESLKDSMMQKRLRIFTSGLAAILLPMTDTNAQTAAKTSGTEVSSSTINQTDLSGKRHGTWLLTQPSKMGEDSYSEFGIYEHGNKTGPWNKLDNEGNVLAIENFKNDVLDGQVKYFEKGRLICMGFYRGLNPSRPFDTIMVEDPGTGAQVLRVVATEKGTMRHGMWRFYDADNGRLTREEDYQIDEIVYKKDFPLSKDDSAYYEKRNAKLPHGKKTYYQPPPAKKVTYLNGKKGN